MLEEIFSHDHHAHEKKSENFSHRIGSIVMTIIVSAIIGFFSGGIGMYVGSFVFQKNIIPGVQKGVQEFKEQAVSLQVTEDSATIDVVRKTSPSVVSIIISKELSQLYNRSGRNIVPFDNFFDFGFPNDFQFEPPPQGGENKSNKKEQKQRIGGGSGFVASSDGLIVTNKHVVEDSDAEYMVVMNDGKEYPGKVLAQDPVNDLAIIKIDAKNLTPLILGDSSALQIGQTVIAIGNTLGEYRNTVTRGVVSGINRVVEAAGSAGGAEVIQEAIQTDAAINPGNSGGPLLNLAGEVVGVNTAVSRAGQSVAFAIPINSVKKSVESVKKNGRIVRPWIGVRYQLIGEEMAQKNNLPVKEGAIIVGDVSKKEFGVISGSPAEKAGLQEGDIILEVNGEKIGVGHALSNAVMKYNPGDEITLKVLSKGKEKEVKVKLEEFKEQK
ncbi:trypsin-like peptidase domain-containing protein [Candidatus Uhrbacteria bacterium]|nr:trypsin-like peptidase domain-containing protein [Candidatus Uhrbacteria bacterium]